MIKAFLENKTLKLYKNEDAELINEYKVTYSTNTYDMVGLYPFMIVVKINNTKIIWRY